jgi:hypothetical protein
LFDRSLVALGVDDPDSRRSQAVLSPCS